MFNEYEPQPLVLVVDDDLFIRRMLQNLLNEQGYQVVEAQDGIQAIEAFKVQKPNLILLDAAMPTMDGFSACSELKQLDVNNEVPVMMITSLDDESSIDKAFKAGAVEYITKPIHWAVLRHRVQVIVRAQRMSAALRESEARFRGIFEQAAIGMALIDMKGQLLYGNPAIQTMLNQNETELKRKLFSKFFYPYDTLVERDLFQQLLHGQRDFYQMEKYFFRKNAPMLWGRLTTSLVRNSQNQPEFIIQMIEDITERKRAQAKQRLSAKVFETTSDGVMITNAEGHIIDVNQAFLLITGYSYEEVLDQNPRFLQSGHHDKTFYEIMWEECRETGRWRGEIWNRKKNGDTYSSWMSLSAVRGEHNEITHYVAVYSDINTLKTDDLRLRLLTQYDALTELPNRSLFYELLRRACRQEERLALLYIDLDDFKQINEHFGFDIGDEVLKVIASRLQQCIREGDSVSRLEGDEFGVILAPIHQDHEVQVMADKIFATLTAPVSIQEYTPQIDCNIGISFYTHHYNTQQEDIETLIQHADMAVYLAKEAGKNTYYIYSAAAMS